MQSISWSTYITTIVSLTLAYYGVVLLVFYKSSVRKIFHRGTSQQFPPVAEANSHYTAAGALAETLEDIMHAAMTKGETKEMLYASIRTQYKRHPQLKGTDFQAGIDMLVYQRLLANYSVQHAELRDLWD